MAEGNIHVTIAIIMHFCERTREEHSNHLREEPEQIGTTNNCSSRGTVVLDEDLWYVPLAAGILDDRDALRGSRSILKSPYMGRRRVSSRNTVHYVCTRLRRDPARVFQSRSTSAACRPPATFPAPKRRVTEAELVRKVN